MLIEFSVFELIIGGALCDCAQDLPLEVVDEVGVLIYAGLFFCKDLVEQEFSAAVGVALCHLEYSIICS